MALHKLTCEVCKKTFEARKRTARTCGASCNTTRWRREQRAELLRLRQKDPR